MDTDPKENELVDIDPSEIYSKKKSKYRSSKPRKKQAITDFKETVTEDSVADKPVVEEPAVEKPLVQQPVAEEPVALVEKHVAEEPVVDKHVGEEPLVEIPLVEIPLVEQPIAEPKETSNKTISMEELDQPNHQVHDDVVKTQEIIDNKNIIDLLKDIINNASITENVSIKLDDKTKKCFMYILQTYPNDLDGFDKLIQIVIEDSKIDMQDLPVIINLCSKTHSLISKTNVDYKSAIECSRLVLKFTIRVLINEKKINIEYDKISSFLNGFDNLIDVCLDMLIEAKTVENRCNTFFKKLLCKKK